MPVPLSVPDIVMSVPLSLPVQVYGLLLLFSVPSAESPPYELPERRQPLSGGPEDTEPSLQHPLGGPHPDDPADKDDPFGLDAINNARKLRQSNLSLRII